jgi:hypothetical protein
LWIIRDPGHYECGCLIRAIAWFTEGKFMEARHVARGEARRVEPIGDQIDVGQSEAAQVQARLDGAYREDVGSVLVARSSRSSST